MPSQLWLLIFMYFLNFFIQHVGVSKHVYNARDRVNDDEEEEEELESLVVLYTLVTMAAPALLLTLTTCINY